MKKSKFTLLTITTILFSFALISCANESEEKESHASNYSCQQTTFTKDNGWQKSTCVDLPTQVNIKLEGLKVPTGETLTMRFFAENETKGFILKFTPAQVSAQITGGKPAITGVVDLATAKNFCIEIHDITNEKHVQVYYNTETCSGTALVDYDDDAAPAVTSRDVRYQFSKDTIDLAELHIEKEGTAHSHQILE